MLWYRGETAAAYYHASCGGTLEAAAAGAHALPYLRAGRDEFCIRLVEGDTGFEPTHYGRRSVARPNAELSARRRRELTV